MPSIFVNYRSGDTDSVAALVERELSSRFGPRVFFRASKSIPPGDDWMHALLRAVRQSDVLLAFIGPHWLETDAAGRRKIDRAGDWTRQEIMEAFRYDVRVIPVLVGAVQPLRAEDLPDDLARLAMCQYIRLDRRTQDSDLDLLAEQLAKLVPGLEEWPGDGSKGGRGTGPSQPGSGGSRNTAGRDFIANIVADNFHGDVNYGPGEAAGRGHGPRGGGSGDEDER
ncbi:toll/interleukin-1 receptor domain-containing protein [Actinomadura livida]|uniref:TIR domain-containing protein n=1 Tax=Actinomadura livida TaxID=79909 RepID=A0A7W7IAQ3_9ACTN|nr:MULTISPECIES: toll/interleukin-1 receptor domain-containing protein [Actinomadura]MBB4773563.1 hypothetical protein [Actinomadura catellatispora]GGU09188.1 hypothetical protein GCM10010208_37050 [Actinomadura livida]